MLCYKSGFKAIILFILLSISPFSYTQGHTAVSSLPDIFYGSLDNGFEYILVPLQNSDKGRVDIRIQVNVGSIDEQDNEVGVAHMVEHMVFRASGGFTQGVSKKLADDGWIRGKHYNAVTNYDRTQYMFSPPNGTKGVNETLNVIQQMMSAALFNIEDWQSEQKIIYEEWRGGLGSNVNSNKF